jgi:hypothetical protein
VTDPVIAGNPSSNLIGVGTSDGIADDSTAGDGSLGGGSLISPCKQTLRLRGTSGSIHDGTLRAVEYLPNSRCVHVIESASAARPRVKLTFHIFDTEQFMDVVSVFDSEEGAAAYEAGNDPDGDHLMGKYSSYGIPGDGVLVSPGSTMVLVFETDAAHNRRGWSAEWGVTDEIPRRPDAEAQGALCVGDGAILSASNGTFQESAKDAIYKSNSDCTWTIQPYEGTQSIRLSFDHLQLEDGYDFVSLFTKKAHEGTLKPLARLTGSLKPGVNAADAYYALGGDWMVIRFQSDAKTNLRGFDARWREATAQEATAAKDSLHSCVDGVKNGFETGVDCGGSECYPCGGTCSGTTMLHWNETSVAQQLAADEPAVILTQAGSFTDGSEPLSKYDSNRRCRFLMIAPPHKLVSLTFRRIDTEETKDVIRVYDGEFETEYDARVFLGFDASLGSSMSASSDVDEEELSASKAIGQYSGRYTPGRLKKIGVDNVGELISSGPAMLVTFSSDSSSSDYGFQAFWELRDNPNMLRFNDSSLSKATLVFGILSFCMLLAVFAFIWRRTHKTHHHVKKLLHHHSMLHNKFDEEFDGDDDGMSLNAYPTTKNNDEELPFSKPRSMRRTVVAEPANEPSAEEVASSASAAEPSCVTNPAAAAAEMESFSLDIKTD